MYNTCKIRDETDCVDSSKIPVNVISGCGWEIVIQHMMYRYSIQSSGSRVCSAQHIALSTLEAGVFILPLVQRHLAVHANRCYIAFVQEHTDPVASAIRVTEYDYLFPIGYFRLDIF